jgi:hypothetical protein
MVVAKVTTKKRDRCWCGIWGEILHAAAWSQALMIW